MAAFTSLQGPLADFKSLSACPLAHRSDRRSSFRHWSAGFVRSALQSGNARGYDLNRCLDLIDLADHLPAPPIIKPAGDQHPVLVQVACVVSIEPNVIGRSALRPRGGLIIPKLGGKGSLVGGTLARALYVAGKI